MDAINKKIISAMEQVICASEDCFCRIKQDLDNETLIIENNFGQITHMNCRMNSVGATIRQLCKHLYKHDLFSHESNYVIGD